MSHYRSNCRQSWQSRFDEKVSPALHLVIENKSSLPHVRASAEPALDMILWNFTCRVMEKSFSPSKKLGAPTSALDQSATARAPRQLFIPESCPTRPSIQQIGGKNTRNVTTPDTPAACKTKSRQIQTHQLVGYFPNSSLKISSALSGYANDRVTVLIVIYFTK